jgi:hypothetical protein
VKRKTRPINTIDEVRRIDLLTFELFFIDKKGKKPI